MRRPPTSYPRRISSGSSTASSSDWTTGPGAEAETRHTRTAARAGSLVRPILSETVTVQSSPAVAKPLAALRNLVIVVGFDGVRDVQTQFAEFHPQRLAGDPQQAGGLVLVAASVFQDAGQEEAVH